MAGSTTSPPGRKAPRFGLGADGTSSPLMLMIKIVGLAFMAAVALWAALPLFRDRELGGAGRRGRRHRAGVLRLPVPPRRADEVPAAGHALPDRLPGRPGGLHRLDRLHELRRRPPRHQGAGHHGHRGRLGQAGPRLHDLHPDAGHRRRRGDGRHRLPARPTRRTQESFVGTADGLEPLEEGTFESATPGGKITAADDYTVLTVPEVNARQDDITAFSVPTDDGAIKSQGLSAAFEGAPQQSYDAECDCITDATTGNVWTADAEEGSFVSEDGTQRNLAQGWKVNVGFDNFARVFTNDTIRGSFLRIVVWNFAFAIGTVVITFALGLLVAIALNNPLMRGRTLYRSLIILPYAMPSIAMYLVWREMFNKDFGLINRLLGTDINWFGSTASSMFAILLIQLWLGYNYMFLVITGALQSISSDLVEAAGVDGAKPFYAFRTITFPLLLVALAPLLITSFAFNFNNFAAIYLTSEGAPVPARQPEGRQHRHPDHVHLPAGVRWVGCRLRVRRRHLGAHLPDRRDRLDRQLPPHPGPGGDQLMAHYDIRRRPQPAGGRRRRRPRWCGSAPPRAAGSAAPA